MFAEQLKQRLQKNNSNCNNLNKLCLSNYKDNSVFLSKNISSFSSNNRIAPKIYYSSSNNSINYNNTNNSNNSNKDEKIILGKFKKILVDLIKSGYIVTGGLNTTILQSSSGYFNITGNLLPIKTNFYSLGNNLKKWKNLFLTNSIYLNDKEIKYDVSNNRFEFDGNVKITNKLILSSANKEIYYNTTDNKFIIDGDVKINGALESTSGCGGVKYLDNIIYVNKLVVLEELIATTVKHKDMSGTDLSGKKTLNLFFKDTSGTPDFIYPCDNADILLIGNNTLIAATSYILQIKGNAYFSDTVRALKFKALSDKRLKTNIHKIQNPLTIINKLRGVTFNWKSNFQSSCGIIAQEVEKAIPEAVDDNNNNDYKTVDYSCIIGYLIEGVKENNKIIKKQTKKIKKLESQNKKLQENYNQLNEKILKLEKLLN